MNKLTKNIKKVINDTKETVLRLKSKYNVKEAEDILSKAEEAFKNGEYFKAFKLALKARKRAISTLSYLSLFTNTEGELLWK